MQQGAGTLLGGLAAAVVAANHLGAGVPNPALDGDGIGTRNQQIANKRPTQIMTTLRRGEQIGARSGRIGRDQPYLLCVSDVDT